MPCAHRLHRCPHFHIAISLGSFVFYRISLISVLAVASWAQTYTSTSTTPSLYLPQTSAQNPLLGSVPDQKPTPGVLPLTFKDAMERALRHNLNALLSDYNTTAARGQKWEQLSELLPNVNSDIQEVAQKQSLEALGLRGRLGPIQFPRVIGPFSYFDMRASATQTLFDWKSIQKYRSSMRSEAVAQFSLKDARELVALATGDVYLQAIAGAARVETAQAQVETAKALYDKAVDQQQAGVSALIDTLRAQVEYQTRQQQLIAATNDFAKQKLTVARVVGLAPGQEFELADKAPYQEFPIPDVASSLQRAYSLRSDYKAAQDRFRAAELELSAAVAGYYPSLSIAANYGDIGKVPGSLLPTYGVIGTLNIPIFQGGKVHSDVLKAQASLWQAKAQLADLRGQIDEDVRTALLDLKSAADQVQVAQSSVNLAEQELTQSRDRFTAGVTDNLEVIQAQETVASAHESLISSLYQHNLAKVSYARAIGRAEQGVREYLEGK
jgi:outer membrane protein TolC